MWDQIVQKCNSFTKSGGRELEFVAAFQGDCFDMIAPQYKTLCIKEYIRDQEAAYYEQTVAFRATLKKLPDSQLRLFDGLVLNTRVVAKVMSIFKSQGVFQRDVEIAWSGS